VDNFIWFLFRAVRDWLRFEFSAQNPQELRPVNTMEGLAQLFEESSIVHDEIQCVVFSGKAPLLFLRIHQKLLIWEISLRECLKSLSQINSPLMNTDKR
jgi:hypothetical protein